MHGSEHGTTPIFKTDDPDPAAKKTRLWLPLTELGDAPHACGQQTLLYSAQLGLAVSITSLP